MLAITDPTEAYRRSDFDARVQAGDTAALVNLCLEQAILAIGGAQHAQMAANPVMRSKALTRAVTAVIALEMGVDPAAPLGEALLSVYGAIRQSLLDSAVKFDSKALASARQDLIDIKDALNRTK